MNTMNPKQSQAAQAQAAHPTTEVQTMKLRAHYDNDTRQVIVKPGLLGISPKQFSVEIEEAVRGNPDAHHNYIVRSIGYQLRREIQAVARTRENNLAFSVARLIQQDFTPAVANIVAGHIDSLVAGHEALVAEYEQHGVLLSGMGDYEWELHLFTIRVQADETLDIPLVEERPFEDEGDEAALWLEKAELERFMAQDELRKEDNNGKARSLMGEEAPVEYLPVNADEYREYLLSRTPEMWAEAAVFGAWGYAKRVIAQWKANPDNALPIEYLTKGNLSSNVVRAPRELPERPAAFSRFVARKAVDAEARTLTLNQQADRIRDRIHELDNDEASLTIAAVSNSKQEDDLKEITDELREMELVHNSLADLTSELRAVLEFTNLENPISAYETFTPFDPVEFTVETMRRKAKAMGEVIGLEFLTKARRIAEAKLQNPVIAQFETDDGLVLWSVRYAADSKAKVVEAARAINMMRALHSRTEDFNKRKRAMAEMLKSTAMRNKRTTSAEQLDAATEAFLF